MAQTTSPSFCEVYLTRHGETNWNLIGKLQGHTDIELNEKGESQASELNSIFSELDFTRIYASDLKRASKTAQIIIGDKYSMIEYSPKLRERCMGAWEGRLVSELRAFELECSVEMANRTADKKDFLDYRWDEGIESYNEVYERLTGFLKETISMENLYGNRILVVTHGGVLNSIMYTFSYSKGFRWKVSNCAWLKVRIYDNGNIELVEYNNIELEECTKSQKLTI